MDQNKENENIFADEDLVVLKDEDGKEIEFIQIATIDYDDEWYAFLQPTELGDLEDDEMIIFKMEEDENGETIFIPIEDEDLMNKVYDEYVKEYENMQEECKDCTSSSCEGCSKFEE